jgi:hypothetical protein
MHFNQAAQTFDDCRFGAVILSFGIGSVYLKWAFSTVDGSFSASVSSASSS